MAYTKLSIGFVLLHVDTEGVRSFSKRLKPFWNTVKRPSLRAEERAKAILVIYLSAF
jgi:hypothetical protein